MRTLPASTIDVFARHFAGHPDLCRQFSECGREVTVPAGGVFLRPGARVETFAFVTEGALRVVKSDANGREITLYCVEAGGCCTVNVLCLLADRPCPALASADEDTRAVVYPRDLFLHWMAASDAFRSFIHDQLAGRMVEIMALVEEVAFQRMDSRLAAYLRDRAERTGSSELKLTHEAVAQELGTAREVVSRLLKSLEAKGAVVLGRGRIVVRDSAALQPPL